MAYGMLRKLGLARAKLDEAVALRPHCGRTLFNRGVLHLMGGEISVHSEYGRGSRFEATFVLGRGGGTAHRAARARILLGRACTEGRVVC